MDTQRKATVITKMVLFILLLLLATYFLTRPVDAKDATPEFIHGYIIVPTTFDMFSRAGHPFVGKVYDSAEAAREELYEHVTNNKDQWPDQPLISLTPVNVDPLVTPNSALEISVNYTLKCHGHTSPQKQVYQIKYIEDARGQ